MLHLVARGQAEFLLVQHRRHGRLGDLRSGRDGETGQHPQDEQPAQREVEMLWCGKTRQAGLRVVHGINDEARMK